MTSLVLQDLPGLCATRGDRFDRVLTQHSGIPSDMLRLAWLLRKRQVAVTELLPGDVVMVPDDVWVVRNVEQAGEAAPGLWLVWTTQGTMLAPQDPTKLFWIVDRSALGYTPGRVEFHSRAVGGTP